MVRRTEHRRRDVLALGSVLLAATAGGGCGFHPLYGTGEDGAEGPAQLELAMVSVGPIPERQGQLLRQALQGRFTRGGESTTRRFDLTVALVVAEAGVAIQPDTSVTFQRVTGTASWTLQSQDAARNVLASGSAKAVDGFNWINEQFFQATLEEELVRRRIAESLADQITIQLADYFLKHPQSG